MKATFNPAAKTKFTTSHRKEGKVDLKCYKIVSVEPSEDRRRSLMTRIDLRIYHTKSTCFACLWVWGCDQDVQGSGRAGGYGYHRASAAVGEAIRNAGFTLDQDIEGRGDGAIESALHAMADALNIGAYGLVESHA